MFSISEDKRASCCMMLLTRSFGLGTSAIKPRRFASALAERTVWRRISGVSICALGGAAEDRCGAIGFPSQMISLRQRDQIAFVMLLPVQTQKGIKPLPPNNHLAGRTITRSFWIESLCLVDKPDRQNLNVGTQRVRMLAHATMDCEFHENFTPFRRCSSRLHDSAIAYSDNS